MEIKHLKKEYTPDKHDYSLGVRLTREDFKGEKIKEVVLRIKVPSFLNWSSTGEILKRKEENNYTIFEIRKERSIYPQDTPLEILGPKSDLGEILYSVTEENYERYKTEALYWELYGDGIWAQKGSKPLSELENF